MGKITVKFFASFREATGKSQIEMDPSQCKDVGELLDALVKQFGKNLEKQLYEGGTRKLRETVNILVDGRGINLLKGLNTPLADGNVVAIFPPVSGG
jgi:molybdopterin synthase sulfur carrier subunit